MPDRAISQRLDPIAAYAALRHEGEAGLLLDGRGGYDGAWPTTLALAPRISERLRAKGSEARALVARVERCVARRRAVGGAGGTGVALLLSYEAFQEGGRQDDAPWNVLALTVDAAIRWREGGSSWGVGDGDRIHRAVATLDRVASRQRSPVARAASPRTSLPREAYLGAAARIKDHIARGDIYQANLTQRVTARWAGDPLDLYAALAVATPAPRSAFVEAGGVSLVSLSPEMFVDVDASGRAETRPIKGTRPRGATEAADAASAGSLLASAKDNAELTMIVDLERNDLGRIAQAGTVRVPELAALRSYPAVHHLVARVEARLRGGIGIAGITEAIFPGGSITGAPKIRAMQILRELEPVARGLYTGSLFWLDDDGSTASSILIRSLVSAGGEVSVGAGGGVVADSDPEAEWMESNAKIRALTRALGFEPEDAL